MGMESPLCQEANRCLHETTKKKVRVSVFFVELGEDSFLVHFSNPL